MIRSARISDCGKYRYGLTRDWAAYLPIMTLCMLNLSIADGAKDDPTIKQCISFARGYGYGGIRVLNSFAYWATNPKRLLAARDPVGPDNATWLNTCRAVPKGFGAHITWVCDIMKSRGAQCFGMNADGSPKHPLYLSKCTRLIDWTHT